MSSREMRSWSLQALLVITGAKIFAEETILLVACTT